MNADRRFGPNVEVLEARRFSSSAVSNLVGVPVQFALLFEDFGIMARADTLVAEWSVATERRSIQQHT